LTKGATTKRKYKPSSKPTVDSEWLSVKAFAEATGLSDNSVYEMVRLYLIPAKRVGPKERVIRISRDSLLSYMAAVDKPWIGKKKGGSAQ
jgi:hypothetical protein